MNIALIPARAGSKRLPRKNVLPIAGKPLWRWSVDVALEAGCFDEVWVSTDCEEILTDRIWLDDERFHLHSRLSTVANDDQTTEQMIAIWNHGTLLRWTTLTLLQPTSPCRSVHTVRKALSYLDRADSVVTVDGTNVELWSNGAVYCVRRAFWNATGALTGGKMAALVIPAHEAIDIDTQADFDRAERYLKR